LSSTPAQAAFFGNCLVHGARGGNLQLQRAVWPMRVSVCGPTAQRPAKMHVVDAMT
jgi:hypothetical protein